MKEDRSIYLALEEVNAQKRTNQCAAMHAMAALFLLIYALQYVATWKEDWMYMFTLAPLSIYILIKAFFRKKFFREPHTNRSFRILEIGFLFMGGMHFLQNHHSFGGVLYVALTTILLSLLYVEMRILQEQYVILKEDRVVVEMLLRDRTYHRKEIKHILIKNGYLTIQFSDDRFLQYQLKNREDVVPENWMNING